MESRVVLRVRVLCNLLLFCLIHSSFAESECSIDRCLYGHDYCVSGRGCLYGCQPGYSGQNCDRTCSSGCLECLWNGHSETCTMCRPGKYGPGCTENCSNNCRINQTKCDSSGRCIYGCEVGWRGDKCDEQDCDFENCVSCGVSNNYIYCSNCTTGKFWNATSHSCVNCSSFCKGGGLACNTTTGVCYYGCQAGYFGYNCDKRCFIDHCNQCRENPYNYNLVYCDSCDEGYYKKFRVCVACERNCINGEHCNGNTGSCDNGCAPGWYGSTCEHRCLIGNCTQCVSVGSTSVTCKQCNSGFYWNGVGCKECSVNCKGGQFACNSSDGSCVDGCEPGFFGRRCTWNCSSHCAKEGLCDDRGVCTEGCKQGWYNPQCDRQCPSECAACDTFKETGKCPECLSGWYGTLCDKQCSRYCKRNAYSNFLHCDKDTGSCVEGCIAGYYGDFCNLTCSEHCQFKECYRENGKCKYPCTNLRFGDYCEKTCSNTCSSQSTDSTAKLPCNEITLMCVYGCVGGSYGDYCNKTCPHNCKDGQCDRVSGMCKECVSGFYGAHCDTSCPHNCKNGACHYIDGSCIEGCLNNMFGRNCSSSCSTRCVGGSCFHQNGYCDKGCDSGWYGLECENMCSSKCLDSVCEQLSGRCSKGCMEGWTGDKCDIKCTAGSFGANCDHTCGVCVNNEACDYRSGACPLGCAEGWTGSTCHIDLRTSESLKDKNTDTMAIAGSVTAAMLLTVLTIVIVTIIVRRKHMHLCSKPQKSSDPLEGEGHSPEEGIPLLTTICPWLRHQAEHEDRNTYGFQMDVGTAIRNADRDCPFTDGHRDFELDREFLQVFTVASIHQMLDISFHTGEYKQHNVLIKCLHKGRDRNQMVRFRNELDILRSLRDGNSNIFTLYGHCEDEKYEYGVFEKCDNGSLMQHLKQLRYSSESPPDAIFNVNATELMSYALDVLLGVIYLQERKIIHRLVIPMNVYLFSNKRAKLANFYFAINLSTESNPEPVPRKYFPWLAVESKKRRQYSDESEVWTFGVLLLEIISLGYPFPEEENEFYLMPPKSCDRKLCGVMESCWRLSPASRPSCQKLFSQLKAIRQNLEVNQDDSIVMTTVV